MNQQILLAKTSVKRFAAAAFLGTAILFTSANVHAQAQTPPSPASEATATIGGKAVSIKYSAPSVKGRKIFGEGGRLASDRTYPIWRAGANSATALHTEGDLEIGGVMVPKGDYTLYVDLTNADAWELVINKQTKQWGTNYNKAEDLGRAKMKMSKPSAAVETLKYTVDGNGNKGAIKLEWDNYSATVPVTSK